ncbi:hypothetical protein OH77DRAFT_1580440 [Trametes cingulata]|nr:hypothetical protein OH77DRAFT_1580440 [Trametes cingulata]
MLLASWLHLAAHLPFRFCDVVLTVIGYILAEAGQASLVPELRTSLSGCLSALRLDPHIKTYPTCPQCRKPFPEDMAEDLNARCTDCGHTLFKSEPATNPSLRGQRQRGTWKSRKPYVRTPAKTITEQLVDLLLQPGMEDALCSWRRRSRLAGWLCDFFDGAISKFLLGINGLPFFRHDLQEDPDGEITIGLALGVDWFSYLRSLILPSYTSCPMSFNIVNLPPFLHNLLLTMIIPGPKETDPDQTQKYLQIIVSGLLRLWRDGVIILTHTHPNGHRVRVILVGVFCDKPAAHKMGGFGSHAHTFFCTRDWITQGIKATLAAFTHGGCPPRTDDHHRRMMREYQNCATRHAREEYAKAYGTRWSELGRLPYFDLCCMIVVDPMHNLFLGFVKTHFYHIWIQLKIFRKNHEIRRLHDILANLDLPAKLGRLPRLMGEPAGGSLTADQWSILAVVVGPLALTELWDGIEEEQLPTDFLQKRLDWIRGVAEARKAQQRAKRSRVTRRSKGKSKPKPALSQGVPESADSSGPRRSSQTRNPSAKAKACHCEGLVLDLDDAGALPGSGDDDWVNADADDEDDTPLSCQLHPRDLSNFLKLCKALQLLLNDHINETQLVQADALIREYCIELIELYGPDVIRPNHHYATHTPDFVRDYGPLRGFWTFLFERLNKILKSYRTNNHEGGEIEATFFREFHRMATLHHTLTQGLLCPSTTSFHLTSRIMQEATSDNRGALQQLAKELDDMHSDDNTALALSPRSATEEMDEDVYFVLLTYLNARFPLRSFHSDVAVPINPDSELLLNLATSYDYAVVSGHRYHAAARAIASTNSLALVRVSEAGSTWVRNIRHILLYSAAALPQELFAYVQWLCPAAGVTFAGTPWEASRHICTAVLDHHAHQL